MDDILHDPIWCSAPCGVSVHTGTENGREEANGAYRISRIILMIFPSLRARYFLHLACRDPAGVVPRLLRDPGRARDQTPAARTGPGPEPDSPCAYQWLSISPPVQLTQHDISQAKFVPLVGSIH